MEKWLFDMVEDNKSFLKIIKTRPIFKSKIDFNNLKVEKMIIP